MSSLREPRVATCDAQQRRARMERLAALLEGELRCVTHKPGVVGEAALGGGGGGGGVLADIADVASARRRPPPLTIAHGASPTSAPLVIGSPLSSYHQSGSAAASGSLRSPLLLSPLSPSGGGGGRSRAGVGAAASTPGVSQRVAVTFALVDGGRADFGASVSSALGDDDDDFFADTAALKHHANVASVADWRPAPIVVGENALVQNNELFRLKHARCEPATAAGARVERVFSLVTVEAPEFDRATRF